MTRLKNELECVSGLMEQNINLNARVVMAQEEYRGKQGFRASHGLAL